MNKFFKNAFCSLSLLLVFSFQLSAQGFLRVNGTKIENNDNKDFILRGMGFGGWMLQEGYMFHLGFLGQQYKIKQKITDLIGKKQADIFYAKWLKYHTQKTDIDSMASWGFNSITASDALRSFYFACKRRTGSREKYMAAHRF